MSEIISSMTSTRSLASVIMF